MKPKLLIKIALFLGAFFSFYLSFQHNYFGFCDDKLFNNFAQGSGAFIINRVALSEKFGNSSYAGLLGRIPSWDNPSNLSFPLYRDRSNLTDYYSKVKPAITEENFKPYFSNVGVQGQIFGWLNNSGLLLPGYNFLNYRGIMSAIAALTLGLLILFIFTEFNGLAAVIIALLILQLDWIVTSASHFFWFSGLMFSPFVFNLWVIKKADERFRGMLVCLFIGSLILTAMKCLTSGYEVITTFLIMNTLPAFYFTFKNKWRAFTALSVFAVISLGSLSGVVAGSLYQVQKIGEIKGSRKAGFEHLKSSFTRRSSSESRLKRKHIPERIKRSYRASPLEVIQKYWKSDVIVLESGKTGKQFILKSHHCLYSLLILTALVFVLWLKKILPVKDFRQILGLTIMTWVSVLGPISMFVIFKSLAYLHPHLMPVTWNLPFSILICLLWIVFIKSLWKVFEPKDRLETV